MKNILWFEELCKNDVEIVGGKNSSLGEMIQNITQLGIRVPNGFATTASAYGEFIAQNQLAAPIKAALDNLDVNDVTALAETGQRIRQWILDAEFSEAFREEISQAFQQLTAITGDELSVAVRSSATAEDLPEASFAGQQETYLNVRGIDDVLCAIKKVFASLYNDRAIAYRVHHQFNHEDVALSAGIQQMVHSETSGVLFSMDTESGFDDVVFITASYGLGETIVQGEVNPDEYYVYKPALAQGKSAILRRNLGYKAIKMIFAEGHSEQHLNNGSENLANTVTTVEVDPAQQGQFCLSDQDVMQLAQHAIAIEQHYGRPMDIEWAKDQHDGQLYILQARPETVQSRADQQNLENYRLLSQGEVLAKGRSIGQKIGQGKAKLLTSIEQMDRLQPGDVLVTDMTDPDWEPIMKRASAIVTNRGGRTCHAAIIARELGIPAVVGCQDATDKITENTEITVSCAEGETGFIYAGLQRFEVDKVALGDMPEIPVNLMMNVGNPDRAFHFHFLPNAGVGLARLEFIINHMIGIHPRAILNFEQLDTDLQQQILGYTQSYASPKEYYIERLKEGIATIAAAFAPKPVIVRLSDFKSNEYANLIGGDSYEPEEENPMLGFRGAGRYVDASFQDCFKLECDAIKRVRNDMGLTNVALMVPFVRTVNQAQQVVELLAREGLERGHDQLKLYMMCEIPSNAVLADEFLTYFDGFSIGSNDLTQLTLGLDRDSAIVADAFDERDPAVKAMLKMAIDACHRQNKYVGICGQGPSDHPDLATWLLEQGITSMSLNPDSVVENWLALANVGE